MANQFLFVAIFLLFGPQNWAQAVEEALRECVNLHHIEIENFPTANAVFENSKCTLKCYIDKKELATDAINEGFSCPLDPNGICHQGQCITGKEEALRECSHHHNLDFHQLQSSGTTFLNNFCTLRCMLEGHVMSEIHQNEMAHCPHSFHGICHNGVCVMDSEVTQRPTTLPPTTIQPTTNPPQITTEIPDQSFFTHNRLASIEFRILDAEFSTAKFNFLSASICVEQSEDLSKPPKCQSRSCHTNNIHSMTDNPSWYYSCSEMKGTFKSPEYLFVTINQEITQIPIILGSYHENLYDFVNRHASHLKSITGQERFDARLPIYRNQSAEWSKFGELVIEFGFTLRSL